MFHAARAALWAKGLAPKTHKGLLQLFGAHLVLPGILGKEFSTMLKKAFDDRELADYDATRNLDDADVTRLVGDARRFVSKMEEIIRRKMPPADQAP